METSLHQHSVDCHCALFPAKSEPAEPGTHVPLRGPSIVLSPAAGILQWVWGQTPGHRVWGGRGARSPSADHSLYVPWERIYCIPEAFPKISWNPIQKSLRTLLSFKGNIQQRQIQKRNVHWNGGGIHTNFVNYVEKVSLAHRLHCMR